MRHNKRFYLIFLSSPLGDIRALKIWHDNSARTSDEASWYLKHVVLHDLQTREKHYFLCEKWLAIDKDNSQINRVLHVSSKEDKTKFKYMLAKQTKEKLSDEHMWFSVFARPVG